ncbi:MAG: DUF4175 family protein, partial [Bosea sp. (in: a-proteobacteria)]|nr:DUF4175 family protein [Bosea sp. (in: a-proteobacteria)]
MSEAERRKAPDTMDGIRQRLRRLALASRVSLGWERLWPRLWLPLGIVLAFLALSWFGLWTHLPWYGRIVGVLAFAAAFLGSLWHVARVAMPTHRDALVRLDRSFAGGHRPASTLEDSLAVGSSDPVSQALWKLHVERQSRQVAALKVELPHPLMAVRDRRALRAVPLLAAIAAFFVAGPEATQRLSAAFDWQGPPGSSPSTRIDAWIDPPTYTRLPPILIDFAKLASPNLSAPEKSTIVVRVAGKTNMDVVTTGKLETKPAEAKDGEAGTAQPARQAQGSDPQQAVLEKRYILAGNGTLRLTGSGAPGTTLNITAIPDQPPTIAFTDPPKPIVGGQSGGLSISYKAKDDYGLASIEVGVSRPDAATGGRSL